MQKTNFYWHFIFYTVFILSFTMTFLSFTITNSIKNLSKNHAFSIGALNHEVYSIGAVTPHPLGFHFMAAINRAFSIKTMFKYWTQFKFLRIPYCICNILKQPLKGILWNMCSLKLGKPDTLNKETDTF